MLDAPRLPTADCRLPTPPRTTREPAGAPGNPAKVQKIRTFPREPDEHYVEERRVSRELFARLALGPVVVDPCAGFGNIVLEARAAGLRAYGSDLVKRAPAIAGGCDFLSEKWRPPTRVRGDFDIVCNPPFGHRSDLLREFCEAACARAATALLLAPVRRLRCAGPWLQALPLAAVIHPSLRPSMWPGRIYAAKLAAGERLGTGFDEVCWLRFERGREGAPVVSWLREG